MTLKEKINFLKDGLKTIELRALNAYQFNNESHINHMIQLNAIRKLAKLFNEKVPRNE